MHDSPTEELAERRIGRTLNGKWLLESLLGVGGTAAVYAATHRNGSRVAIKILHPTISESDEARLRFKREGYLVNRVEHPGVVRVLDDDIDETDGSAFIVMDRAEGVSLCERVQRRLLDENEVLEVTEQLLEILAAAHEKGVIHRDLKPDNLLVDEAGRVRLLDFGIARLLDDDTNLTRTGFTFGTPAYMAPEQAYGKKALIGPRTDIYAVGATMFTLLCGEYVQEAESAQALLIKIATHPARSIADVRPETSAEVVDLVDRATMMHLEDRWASAEAMLARVRHVMRQRGLLEGSRRHISSRISAMILPALHSQDSPTHEALALVPHEDHDPADEPAEETEIVRESGVDRSSIIRGRHTVPYTQSSDDLPLPLVAAKTRPSIIRVERKRANRTWAIASAIAVVLIAATIGWTRSSHERQTTNAAAGAQVLPANEAKSQPPMEANAEPTSPTKPEAAALNAPPPAKEDVVSPAIAQAAPVSSALPSTGTAKPLKPRRPIDVGY